MQLGATAPRQPAGTPPYMAPEVHASQPYGFGCDVWAIGVTLWEAATKQHPFTPPSLNNFSLQRHSPPYLVRLLAQQAMQAPRFLHLPRNLRSFLSYFFQPQTTRPSATEALGFVHRLPCPPSTASGRGRRTRRVLAFLGLNIINQEFRARRESTVLLV